MILWRHPFGGFQDEAVPRQLLVVIQLHAPPTWVPASTLMPPMVVSWVASRMVPKVMVGSTRSASCDASQALPVNDSRGTGNTGQLAPVVCQMPCSVRDEAGMIGWDSTVLQVIHVQPGWVHNLTI